MSDESPYRRVVVPKGTQLGLTEIGLIWIGQGIVEGQSALVIEPTEAVAKRVVKQKFRPMLQTTTILHGAFTGRAADSTLHFSNALVDVIFAGSNSPSNFASVTVPRFMGDEIDRWAQELLQEGDPVDLGENRIAEFGFLGKMFLPSSPTLEDFITWREWLQSNQQVFKIPCPCCGFKQQLVWEQMRWEAGRPETAKYQCVSCEELSSEIAWKSHWHDGEWVALCETPVRADTAGFHVSSLYARIGQRTWKQIVTTYEAAVASGLETRLRVFWNTVLGLPWKISEDAIAAADLVERLENRERGLVPAGGLCLTAGCDYQRKWVEVWIWAWGPERESWLIDRLIVQRVNPDGTLRPARDIAAELDGHLLKQWPHELGGWLDVEMSIHDSGDRPADVYDVLQHMKAPAIASKGIEGWGETREYRPPRIIDVRKDGKVVMHGRKQITVNTAVAKRTWYDDLRRGAWAEGVSERHVHLPDWIGRHDENVLEQLVAEELRKSSRGKPMWVKVFDRNEGLDCRILADCGRWQLKTHRWSEAAWDERRDVLSQAPKPEPTKAPPAQSSTKADGGWIKRPAGNWMRNGR